MSSLKTVKTNPLSECDLQAVEWYEKMQGATDATTQAAFDVWLSEGPENRQAYLEAELLHETLGELAHAPEAQDLILGAGDISVEHNLAPERQRKALYGLTGMAMAACLAVFSAVNLGWFNTSSDVPTAVMVSKQSFSTAPAEIRKELLSDGTRLVVGPSTMIDVQFDEGKRRVSLLSGEAYFDVAKDSSRPFFVETEDTSVKVVGTRFDVKTRSQGASIGVVEGVVHVFNGRSTARKQGSSMLPTTLLAGQSARSDGVQDIIVENSLSSSELAAWRNGRLVYRGSKLQDVVFDANRYLKQHTIRLNDDTLGSEKITLSVDVDNLDELPLMLSELLNLTVLSSSLETVLSRK